MPKKVAAYYRKVPKTQRQVILEIRRKILEVAPNAEELISYGMPAFRINGIIVAGIMAHRNHIGYYPFSGEILCNFKSDLEEFESSKSAIRIPLDTTLSKALIKKLIRARISQCQVAQGKGDISKYNNLDSNWRQLGIASPARRGLVDNKIFETIDLQKVTRDQLKSIHGIGDFALSVLIKDMKKKKIRFKSK